jgi:hypothetical protein
MNKVSHKRVVDKLVDVYVSWREACLRVSDAYGSWAGETGPGATSSFGWYVAALDQEERAADVYAGDSFGVWDSSPLARTILPNRSAGRRGESARDDPERKRAPVPRGLALGRT